MLSRLFRKIDPAPVTFNDRVAAFWRWFRKVAPRHYATIEDRQAATLGDEMSTKIDELLPGFCWVYGPGEKGVGHSLTLTGEGNIHRQLLALHWLKQAPKIDGWTFHAARQAGPVDGHTIEVNGCPFKAAEIWITPSVDTDNEHVDITVWHPACPEVDERKRAAVTFLFLDEVLGEYGTDWWIGGVDYGKELLAQSFPISELGGYVQKVAQQQGWKKHPPGGVWTLYRFKESQGDFARSDLLTLNTCVPALLQQYGKSAGEWDDPLPGLGADYVYVSIDSAHFPVGEQVARRGEIEEAIEAELAAIDGGRLVGGGMGRDRTYCDFLIFDGKRSLDAIVKALRARQLPAGTMIEFFVRDKRGQRVAL